MFMKQSWQEFARLLSYMKRRRASYITGLILDSLSHASIAILLSFVIQYLIEFSVHRDPAVLQRAVWVVGSTFVLLSILSPFFSFMYIRAVKRTMAEIRLLVFGQLGRLPHPYFEARHSGDLTARMTSDMHLLEQTYTEHVKSLLVESLTLVGSLAVMFALDWRLALVLVTLGLLSVLLNTRFAQPLRRISDRLQEQNGRLTERLTDLLAGLQVIKMFSMHRSVTRQIQEVNADVAATTLRQGRRNGLLDSANFLINFLSLGGMLVIGFIMYTRDLIELGTLGQIIQLQTGVSMVFLQIGSLVSLVQHSLAGAVRIFEVLDEAEEPARYPDTAAAGERSAQDPCELEMRGVNFGYGASGMVLNGTTFKVQKGQTAALVGASGSGKSTVMKLLLGYYPPDSGEIYAAGRPAGEYTLTQLRELIAYVPQEPYLFHGTIGENIRFGRPEATQRELEQAAGDAYAHDFIMQLPDGYDTLVGERGASLSGGQRQRIAIARALLKNAPILLLDEATSALDAESEYWVQQALSALMHERTTLLIAHRLSTVEQADVIYVMEQGAVEESGTHAELLSRGGLYAALHRQQLEQSQLEEEQSAAAPTGRTPAAVPVL